MFILISSIIIIGIPIILLAFVFLYKTPNLDKSYSNNP